MGDIAGLGDGDENSEQIAFERRIHGVIAFPDAYHHRYSFVKCLGFCLALPEKWKATGMDILERLRRMMAHHRQKRAEREALRILVARKDRRMLRDAGLDLIEGSNPGCKPLPQTKERRWTAPLIRLHHPRSSPERSRRTPHFAPHPMPQESDRQAS
jgi:hypothetical protein